jgi:ABC-type transporter Mla subunit MlaD
LNSSDGLRRKSGSPLRYRGVPLGEVSEILDSAAAYERDLPFGQAP